MREIVLTPKAKDTFFSILEFIQNGWGKKAAEKFAIKTSRILDTITSQPYIFKVYQEKDIRKGLITKQTSFVYKVSADRIEVLFFWDNRQEPVDSN